MTFIYRVGDRQGAVLRALSNQREQGRWQRVDEIVAAVMGGLEARR
jgi:hypothetical protein